MADTQTRTGGCHCGKIRFVVSGRPEYPHTCSCTDCQKRSGGPIQWWVSFPLDGLTWIGGGEPTWYDTFPGETRRGFCPVCGSHLTAHDYGDTGIGVNVTALDHHDDADLVPVNQSFRATAVDWIPQVPDTQHTTDGTQQPKPPSQQGPSQPTERHRSIVDVHLILRRPDGRILLGRRAGTGYCDGSLHIVPSGHLEAKESIIDAVIREAQEEVGVIVHSDDLRFVHVMHRAAETGHDRVGLFFTTDRWSGTVHNAEPSKCSELVWADPRNLPADVIPYPAVGLARSLHVPSSTFGFPTDHRTLPAETPTGAATLVDGPAACPVVD